MTDVQIALYKGQRSRLKGSMTKLKTFAENIPIDKRTVEELETRLETLEKLWSEFSAVDDTLVTLDIASEFSEFEDKYFTVKPLLLSTLNSLKRSQMPTNPTVEDLNSSMSKFVEQQRHIFENFTNCSSSQGNSSLEVKLPKVHIPEFSGDYKDWPSFKDLFLTSVDKREGLSDVYKLQYLKGLLRGEAATLVKHITITDANYKEAWSKLINRYDKKRHILNSYIQVFINQPSTSQTSFAALRKLTDTSDELIRGIAALGDDAMKRDPWLIFLILSKTDPDTRQAWAEEISEKDLPSFQDLLKFLAKRCDALEAFEPSLKKFPSAKPTVRTLHSDSSIKCPKCSEDHPIYKCSEFKSMDVETRRNVVKKLALCFNCLSSGHQAQKCKSRFSCHYCNQKHHSCLHSWKVENSTHLSTIRMSTQSAIPGQSHQQSAINFNPNTPPFVQAKSNAENQNGSEHTHINALTSVNPKQIHLSVLPTALVHVEDSTGTLQSCRVLIDSGSQASFVSEECAQRLRLKRERAKVLVKGLAAARSGYTQGRLKLTLSSRHDRSKQIVINALILNKLTSKQPATNFNVDDWTFIKGYSLADPHFNQSNKIDILLGVEHFIQILQQGQHFVSANLPALQNTIFGYIVAGSLIKTTDIPTLTSCHADVADIDATLRKFWETEEPLHRNSEYTLEEQQCESLFVNTHYVDKESGRYTVRLPFKADSTPLGDSLTSASHRMNSLERRFKQNPTLHKEYCAFISEYKRLGHLECASSIKSNSNIEHAFLPHHAVLKDSSTTTKLRVVFDGSAQTSTGISLNQKLLVGPKIQRDLFPILLSFRTYKIALTGDIEKMYRMVLVDERDRRYQRIIWRETSTEPIQHLWLNTVTYGTTSAPFLATRALKQLTIEFKGKFPLAEHAINHNFYVDDLMAGAATVEQAIELQKELVNLLQTRGFHLRKWASNSQQVLDALPSGHGGMTSLRIDENPETVKILGLKWIPADDCFRFDVSPFIKTPATKRKILSETSRIFDPLGFLSPITVVFKIILQRLWLNNYDWDDPIGEDMAKHWNELRNNLHHIQDICIPRWLTTEGEQFQIHGFSDASESAYGAVVYARSNFHSGNNKVTLIAAKTRVAPIKQVSIPKLELCAALLLSQLINTIKSAFQMPNIQCYAWTDSEVVLSWLSSHPRKWKCYVGNRTAEILTILPRSAWNHVTSKDNPADIASRGISPSNLRNLNLWWQGPDWLRNDWMKKINTWPRQSSEKAKLEARETYIDVYHTSIMNDTLVELFQRKSSLSAILRIIATCFRFYRKCKNPTSELSSPWITAEELNYATRICIRWTQAEAFHEEIEALHRRKPVPSSSKLLPLSPFLDNDKILRVGGRLENSACSYHVKHPIILPKTHVFSKLLIACTHQKYFHTGTSLLISILRQRYWIISCRAAVKSHINQCITCVRYRAATSQQLMANLPRDRVSFTRAFENVGVDYAGPIPLLLHRGRGARSTKGYISVFVCFSTKALHLEVTSDLTSEAFISCLKRFISRRGMPVNIYSDNATNFVGAKRKLSEIHNLVTTLNHNVLIAEFLSKSNISWHMNPPAAPHFGGIWEAGVKSVKTLLKKTIGETRLTYEELSTLVTQIEGVLNSRPMMSVSDDISSIEVLTPSHFLIGQPITTLPESPMHDVKISTLTRWRVLQKLLQDFWRRWHVEYLTSLQNRPKWTRTEDNFKTGDMVLIKEDNLPPSAWVLGRVKETHPGSDNLVRVVTIRTKKGDFKRPISKLARLPIC